MKNLSLTLLLLITHLPLYLMDDDEIILDEKSVQKIAECVKKCYHDHHLGCGSGDPNAKICTNICTTLYTCKFKEKLYKERTRVLLAQNQTQQSNKN